MSRSVRGGHGGSSRPAFALPAALVTLVLLSALVVGALVLATDELRAGRGDVGDQRALADAEWVLERAIAGWSPVRNASMPVGATDTLLVIGDDVPDASLAVVSATRVQPFAVWMVATARANAGGGRLPARHTVAASLRLVPPPVPFAAALTAGGAVAVTDAVVSGVDATTPRGEAPSPLACADSAGGVAGILAPDTTRVCGALCGGVPAGVTGDPALATGTPVPMPDSSLTPAIVLAGGAFTPRPSISGAVCNVADANNWGDPGGTSACASYYPVVHVRGSAVLRAGAMGQGTLLVDGDLELEAGARFAGVVIAADDIIVRGAGAEITGVAFAGDADGSDGVRVGDGGAIRFSRCAAARARLGAARLARTSGRWWIELR